MITPRTLAAGLTGALLLAGVFTGVATAADVPAAPPALCAQLDPDVALIGGLALDDAALGQLKAVLHLDTVAEVKERTVDEARAALGCGVVDPVPTTTVTPPPPADELDCADFPLPDGRTAEQVLAADTTDPNRLDLDGDGVPCEQDETAPPTSTSAPVTTTSAPSSTSLSPVPVDVNADGFSQVDDIPVAIDTGRA